MIKTISPAKILNGLLIFIFILLVLNILSYLNLYYNDLSQEDYFFRKTNFNEEKNAPSIFSSLLHFAAAILLAVIGFSKLSIKKNKRFWFGLSFLLLFTGLDELLRIHEKIGQSINTSFNTSGIFLYAWVIPYGLAVIILGIMLIKPLFQLPKITVRNFVISGVIFMVGALGVEMFTGWYIGHYNLNETRLFIIPDIFILTTIEEFLEMMGMSFFVFSNLQFLKKYKYT